MGDLASVRESGQMNESLKYDWSEYYICINASIYVRIFAYFAFNNMTLIVICYVLDKI